MVPGSSLLCFFFFFLLPRCLEQKGVEWMGEWSSDSLQPNHAKKAALPATFETQAPVFKKRKHPHSQVLSSFPRHHIVIYNFAQLLIWFITESQIGTFQGLSEQATFSRQMVCPFLEVSPDSSLKGKPICCSSGQNFNHFKHRYVTLLFLFSNSCLVMSSLKVMQ